MLSGFGSARRPKLRQLLHQPGGHALRRRRLHVAPQRHLEAIPPPAVVAPVEVLLREEYLGVRELAIQIALQQLLARLAGPVAHDSASSASRCFSSRRPRCSLDMTVPIGTSRIWAASA